MTIELTHDTHTAHAPDDRTALTSVEPIIAGFHPDPSICRVGDDYYLVNSSFEYFPGLPVHHSTDLITWTLIGNALSDPDQFAPGHAGASKGIFAPTIRHHDGRFWIITTDVPAGGGQMVISAEHPEGPWSPVITIEALRGIDPDLAWDDDGTCYVTYCSGHDGMPGIAQARVDLERGIALEEPRIIWNGTGLAYPEGPHLYRHDGWWYLLIAEGGTERGHSVSIARSASPTGPFESHEANPILSHRSLTHPVQNTGHADLTIAPDGQWAIVYLGVRPSGATPWFHVNGRETFLAGIDWIDGWPTIDEARFSFAVPDRSFVDDFRGGRLDLRWISPGRGIQAAVDDETGVTLSALEPVDARDALMCRVTDARWQFRVTLDAQDGAGAVVLRLDDEHVAEVHVETGRVAALLKVGPVESILGELDVPAGRVEVLVEAVDSVGGPDDIVLSVSDSGSLREIGRFDGRYLSTEVAGGFTGRVIGVRADHGTIGVERIDYHALDSRSSS